MVRRQTSFGRHDFRFTIWHLFKVTVNAHAGHVAAKETTRYHPTAWFSQLCMQIRSRPMFSLNTALTRYRNAGLRMGRVTVFTKIGGSDPVFCGSSCVRLKWTHLQLHRYGLFFARLIPRVTRTSYPHIRIDASVVCRGLGGLVVIHSVASAEGPGCNSAIAR